MKKLKGGKASGKNKAARNIRISIFAFLIAALFSIVSAQTVKVETNADGLVIKNKIKTIINTDDASTEKSITVDAKVNIQLCVSNGKLKINGWERNEVRAFVDGGSEIGFKILQKDKQNNNVVWVKILGFDPLKNKDSNLGECLSGEQIELDVPRGAVLDIQGQASETTIESVGKVSVENVGGDIFLNNIERGIDAKTYEGDVTVGKSGGAVSLQSTTGNIVAFDVAPGEIGDVFKAKTSSGAITLKNVKHRQMEVVSNSGSMRFAGELQTGGQYTFRTSNGSILLTIPQNSSCKINALYGYGKLDSEFKLETITVNNTSKAQSLVASIGGGDATLNLTTYSGAIHIKKNEK
ncbi:MAG: DUF4097 family beta strand repeat-containing protein [Pyrinomonadaceae bacterium]